MRWDWIAEIFERYFGLIARGWWVLPLLAGVGWVLGTRWWCLSEDAATDSRRARGRWIVLTALVVVLGVAHAWRYTSLIDDAFITFRYARNWSRGLGLVFNPGERVEGYTNFLWVMTLGVIDRITGFEPPGVALVLDVCSLAAVLLVVSLIGRRAAAASGRTAVLPFAAVWLAAHRVFAAWGTTGMETMPATACMMAGLLILLGPAERGRALQSGAVLVIGILLRPDFALFYAAGGLALVAGLPWSDWRRDGTGSTLRRAATVAIAYVLPATVLVAHLLWRESYYGEWLPNTYYAKSAGLFYPTQGAVFSAANLLGTGLWLVLIAGLALLVFPARNRVQRTLRVFAVVSIGLELLYILKTGGDFMFARFVIPLMPIAAVLLESGAWNATAPRGDSDSAPAVYRRVAIIAGVVFAVSLPFFDMIPAGEVRWWMGDEARSSRLAPDLARRPGIDYARSAAAIRRLLTDRGIQPVTASGAIGLLGYDSGLDRIIDLYGLVDPVIAREPLPERRRPGHEKWPRTEYLYQRGVQMMIIDWNPFPDADLTSMDIGGYRWFLLRYDRALMRAIAKKSPEVRFTDFERYLDDYIARVDTIPLETVRRDMGWFIPFYFAWNKDPERYKAIAARLKDAAPPAVANTGL